MHVYEDKVHGGTLWKNLRCQKQKRKRYASGRDRRGQIPNRRPLSERPAHIEGRQQVGHWECDTVIGANHKQGIVTVVERKSGYAVMAKVSKKTADLVGAAIIEALNPLKARVKTLTYDNGKEFGTPGLMNHWSARVTLPGPLRAGSEAPTRTSMACCGNTCPRNARWQALRTRKLR